MKNLAGLGRISLGLGLGHGAGGLAFVDVVMVRS